MPCRATQGGQVTVKSSDKTWSTGWGNGKSLQYSYQENPVDSMKRQKDMTPEDKPPSLEGVQCANGEERRAIMNSSKKSEVVGPKWKQHSVVDVSGDESKVWCYKEQSCIGTWNVRSMNHGKLDMIKQEMARVNIDILRISELKWIEMSKFNSDDHYIYYCVQESLRRNGVALSQQKSPKCSTWVQSQKWQDDLVHF